MHNFILPTNVQIKFTVIVFNHAAVFLWVFWQFSVYRRNAFQHMWVIKLSTHFTRLRGVSVASFSTSKTRFPSCRAARNRCHEIGFVSLTGQYLRPLPFKVYVYFGGVAPSQTCFVPPPLPTGYPNFANIRNRPFFENSSVLPFPIRGIDIIVSDTIIITPVILRYFTRFS